eukprot:m.75925 g.75925  ORF g.75925 m.75925 type:complete len:67 (-) comp13153_c0_seq1:53-253(-)
MQVLVRSATTNKHESRALQLVLALQDMAPLAGPVAVDASLRELVQRACTAISSPGPNLDVRLAQFY